MDQEYPSQRPMGEFRTDVRAEEVGFPDDVSPEQSLIPWIDIHGHHHTLTWHELEKLDLIGCSLVVMSIGNIGDLSPYRPISIEDIQMYWDQAIRLSHAISRSHSYEAKVAIGIHTTNGPIDRIDRLIEKIPAYAALDEVVALSETGITMIQEHETFPIPDQRRLIQKQLQLAKEADLPAILHTPTISKGGSEYANISLETHDTGDLVLNPDTAKLDAVKIDVEIANEVDFPENKLVLTHGHLSSAPWILENTDCYVSFTVGNATRDVAIADIIHAIEQYGTDRIMIDTDCARLKDFDTFEIRRTILELIRQGVSSEDVRRVVHDNQQAVLGY